MFTPMSVIFFSLSLFYSTARGSQISDELHKSKQIGKFLNSNNYASSQQTPYTLVLQNISILDWPVKH